MISDLHIAPAKDSKLQTVLQHAIDHKTKPPGSLGRLELLAAQIGQIQQTASPVLRDPAIIVFAGDHGVVAEGISAFPQDVTWQMVENFLAGGAAINVFARQNGIALHIVDSGVRHEFGQRDGLTDRKVAPGTQNFAKQAAMSPVQCAEAIRHGRELVRGLSGNVLGFGEMGIGNTTAAAAVMHKLTGIPVADCVGAGTGLSPQGIRHKQQVIEAAVALHAGVTAPQEVLACFGGLEIAMMTGAMLEAAQRRMVLLIDGFIVSSALLVAARLQPAILDYCVFSHQSDESGHARMLDALQVSPVLKLDLRLGEGTGAALVYPMVQAAVNFLNQMATFGDARVSEKTAD
ncbi:nicotinate-nucleotide--dimethylbenzimidazole phosphoribosyltransferase [Undibacterium oligocarboniphilum]|uniref:Nicotinate-nucleotide--dimethylbenzimidazole phosphoribosyltransferase n=1 Tax=Undibacterium oligocarboniphilum TaxID=666702 RepID=A0A850QIC8_9BURK|nr:nicotinate-nucleotide--dimethylbenzimidazole phosphoribosyltransferase [Undibacterium oligocarboniphilum]MBC3871817.1 nicotinate-nucleotide--dimethylbenzimidazole phosphoribosyltransferase [Undibacterium oligocarboniphilum]NVO79331.1 nicotinate-nucleotide--dimethylbenzimidazole phosphoribosyltransferase [Undibacterium oligocarboniphilum]